MMTAAAQVLVFLGGFATAAGILALLGADRTEKAVFKIFGIHTGTATPLYDWQAENRRRQWGVRQWGPL